MTNFQYDQEYASDYQLTVCSFSDSGGVENAPGGSEFSADQIKITGTDEFAIITSDYASALLFTFQACKIDANHSPAEISAEEFSKINRWVNRKEFMVYNHSDETGDIYPYTVIKCLESGDLRIVNSMDSEEFELKNCSVNEIITVDNKHRVITSSDSNHDLNEDFNFNYIKLCNTYAENQCKKFVAAEQTKKMQTIAFDTCKSCAGKTRGNRQCIFRKLPYTIKRWRRTHLYCV